ncbi:MAG TPA: N-acetyltransferase [Methanoculleus sp.]|nr:N-acetyltransferase [Methanoculleus sp.]
MIRDAAFIRPYADADFEDVWNMNAGMQGASYEGAVFVRQAAFLYPQSFFVLQGPQGVSGFTIAALVQGHHPPEGWILRLHVAEEYRRSGYGRMLLRASIRSLAVSGAGKVLLSVAPDNVAALDLYTSEGFVLVSRAERYFGPGKDRLIMEKSV